MASPPAPAKPWHAVDPRAVAEALACDARAGLSEEEARARVERYGANTLPESPPRTALAVFLGQFKSPLIYLLLVAAAVAGLLGELSDAAVIIVVVVVNAIIGAVQEGRAERSLRALKKLSTVQVRVVRGGVERQVPASALVPGDLMLLGAGDAVAADGRILEAAALQVSEAALTGESVPVAKDTSTVGEAAPLAERHGMLFSGTLVTAGRARALVVATGTTSEIGHIATLTSSTAPTRTPLERRIDQVGRLVIVVAAVLFALVMAIGLVRQVPTAEIFMVAISQIVGLVPEGLPVAMTIALAVGVQRMARRGAVVRRLSAVETLGSTTVICTDKTGTLTKNEMTVTEVALPDGRTLAVDGVGYAPTGALHIGGAPAAVDQATSALLEALVLCNDAQLIVDGDTVRALGDPTEIALVTLARKAGVDEVALRAAAPRVAELPFDAATKMMASVHQRGGAPVAIVKGAPERVLELLGDDGARQELRARAEAMAARALRVLAAVEVPVASPELAGGYAALQGKARALGLVGQIDPPRPEVKEAVARCAAAGIRTVMVTGDHKITGAAIARTLGISRGDEEALDGVDLERLSLPELRARSAHVAVFARVPPEQKLRIVQALQEEGHVVAMTGDGVNDAPALVKADVGVAMGLSGTEVAKDASKIVVTDDNFATIVAAVEEGRVVYRNIKKAVLLLFTTSMAEVLVLLLAMIAGFPPPFAAVQILWNNLVSEGVITVNLIMEPAEGDEMRRPPISPKEPLFSRPLLVRMAFMVPTIVAVTLAWLWWRTALGVPAAQVQTETFTLLVLCEWFNVLNCRSETRSALSFDLLRNPWLLGGLVVGNLLQVAVVFWRPLGQIFHTVPFSLTEVVALGAAASVVLWVEEARKLVVRLRARAQAS
ncbi:MAG: HAD-IC family P-type ATPase [Deltaproteobacteria bacterium]|nr:HAD-IC family P-type ATPase [Deltaproteobacteria bacterium]